MRLGPTLPPAETIALIKTSSPFTSIEEPLLRLIGSNPMTQQLQYFEAGEWVLRQDDLMPDDVGVHVLVEGLAHVLRQVHPHHERNVGDVRRSEYRHVAFRYPPQTSGALLGLSRAPAEVGVRCITTCGVLRLHISDYRFAIRHSDRFADTLYREWSRRFRQYAVRAEWGKYLSQEEAVAAFFYEAGNALARCPQVPFLPMKQEEVASFTGVPFDRLRLKILPQFRKLGLISANRSASRRERGKIYIPDPAKLLMHFPRCTPDSSTN